MYPKFAQKLNTWMARPPKGKASIEFEEATHYATKFGGQARSYQAPPADAPIASPVPIPLGTPSALPQQHFSSEPRTLCLDFNHPGFRFCLHHLIDPEGKVVYHPGFHFQDLPIAQLKLPTRVKKLNSTVAYLSNTAVSHYDQWMSLVLPSLSIYQKYLALDEIDYFYIGDLPTIPHFITECFELLGIPAHKIVHQPCKGKRTLIALTEWKPPTNGLTYLDDSAYEFTRKLVTSQLDLSDNCCYSSKVYIAQGSGQSSKVINEAAVFELLRNYDVECRILDQISIREQAQIFYHADVIIAPQGPSLTNLIFGRKNSKVLEILAHNHLNKTSFALAHHSKMNYFYLNQPIAAMAPHDENIEVDLTLLENFCETHLR